MGYPDLGYCGFVGIHLEQGYHRECWRGGVRGRCHWHVKTAKTHTAANDLKLSIPCSPGEGCRLRRHLHQLQRLYSTLRFRSGQPVQRQRLADTRTAWVDVALFSPRTRKVLRSAYVVACFTGVREDLDAEGPCRFLWRLGRLRPSVRFVLHRLRQQMCARPVFSLQTSQNLVPLVPEVLRLASVPPQHPCQVAVLEADVIANLGILPGKEGYSDGCASCFGDIFGCTRQHCKLKCIGGGGHADMTRQ